MVLSWCWNSLLSRHRHCSSAVASWRRKKLIEVQSWRIVGCTVTLTSTPHLMMMVETVASNSKSPVMPLKIWTTGGLSGSQEGEMCGIVRQLAKLNFIVRNVTYTYMLLGLVNWCKIQSQLCDLIGTWITLDNWICQPTLHTMTCTMLPNHVVCLHNVMYMWTGMWLIVRSNEWCWGKRWCQISGSQIHVADSRLYCRLAMFHNDKLSHS